MVDNGQRIAAGTLLFSEGDPPGSAYLIESGRVEISTGSGERRLVLSYLEAGALLGEMAVIDDAPRSATARAMTDCTLIEIRRDQIVERLGEADPIIRVLLLALLERYRSGLWRMRGSGARPAVSELAKHLKSDSSSNDAIEKFRLESRLISALENDELDMAFQPIYDLRTHRVAGFEALTRWSLPERGPISPAEFIKLAEETSLIVPVGQYALNKTCSALAKLPEFPEIFVAVNVSARQSAVPDFADLVQQIAVAHKVDPRQLKLEITESLTLDYQQVGALISRCDAFGIKVALDDFGTGYSNLGHLHHLHFDTVKMDQSFCRQLLIDPRCHELVRGIVNMIHAIGADVVAEGVETIEQARALSALGVRYLQGWLIGKPAPESAMHAALAMRRDDI
jgi:diguanylate cyclase